MFLWSWQPYFTPEDVPTAQGFMCDIHEARRFLESTFSSCSRKNRSPMSQNIHCWYWFWIHTVMVVAFFSNLMVFSVHLQVYWYSPKPWGWLKWYHKQDCWKNPKVFRVQLKSVLAQGIYQFPQSWSNLWKREREKKKGGKKSLKLSELSNFYHL